MARYTHTHKSLLQGQNLYYITKVFINQWCYDKLLNHLQTW